MEGTWKEWRKYKRMCVNAVATMTQEQGDPKKIYADCMETDEDAGVELPKEFKLVL